MKLTRKLIDTVLFFKPGRKHYGSEVSYGTKTTYSHAYKILGELHDKGFLRTVEGGNKRRKYYELTEKGEELRNHLSKIKKLLEF